MSNTTRKEPNNLENTYLKLGAVNKNNIWEVFTCTYSLSRKRSVEIPYSFDLSPNGK